MKDLRKYSKYFLLAFFVFIFYFSFKIIQPFIITILGAVILAYIFSPMFHFLQKRIKNKTLTAIIVVSLTIVILVLPLIFTITLLQKEAANINQDQLKTALTVFLKDYFGAKTEEYIVQFLEIGVRFIQELWGQLLYSLPTKILGFFVLIFTYFYLIRDGDAIISKTVEFIPLRKEIKERFMKEFKDITHSTVYGLVIGGFVQGVLGALGFFLFGLPNPLLWGLVMMILSILPFLGPIIIWGPAALYLLITGSTTPGILLMVYGAFMTILENVMRPKIISGRTNMHPILVIIGLLGGLKVFGIVGIILGPLILSFLAISLKGYAMDNFQD